MTEPTAEQLFEKAIAAKTGKKLDKASLIRAMEKSESLITGEIYLGDQAETIMGVLISVTGIVLDNPGISLDEALEKAYPQEKDDTECEICGNYIRVSDDDPDLYVHTDWNGNRDTETDDDHDAEPRGAAQVVRGWLDND